MPVVLHLSMTFHGGLKLRGKSESSQPDKVTYFGREEGGRQHTFCATPVIKAFDGAPTIYATNSVTVNSIKGMTDGAADRTQ